MVVFIDTAALSELDILLEGRKSIFSEPITDWRDAFKACRTDYSPTKYVRNGQTLEDKNGTLVPGPNCLAKRRYRLKPPYHCCCEKNGHCLIISAATT